MDYSLTEKIITGLLVFGAVLGNRSDDLYCNVAPLVGNPHLHKVANFRFFQDPKSSLAPIWVAEASRHDYSCETYEN
jgi:hypothetical protein